MSEVESCSTENLFLKEKHPPPKRFRICFVSDFFYPRNGGVEMH